VEYLCKNFYHSSKGRGEVEGIEILEISKKVRLLARRDFDKLVNAVLAVSYGEFERGLSQFAIFGGLLIFLHTV
jgi:hypothetical protein